MCKRNPIDHRIDWWGEKKDANHEDKYLVGTLIKTLVQKTDPITGSCIKAGSKGVVVKVWSSDGQNFYGINFLKLWSVKYREDELELVEE